MIVFDRRSFAVCIGTLSLLPRVPSPITCQTAPWEVERASVTFEIRNAGLTVHGSFDGIYAEICFDPDAPASGSLVASIDPATIQTGIVMRDRHLKRRGYFNVEKYGRVEMRSIRLLRARQAFAGTFLLRIREVEREVEFPFDFAVSGGKARISGSLTIDRLDYGIGKQSLILSNDVVVRVELELIAGKRLGVTADAAWEDWILYVLRAVDETARWTTERIRAIHQLMHDTTEHVRKDAPSVYSRELVALISFSRTAVSRAWSRRESPRGRRRRSI